VLFVVIALLPIRTVYEASKPVLQMHNIEVYRQAEGFATEFEVRKELGVMGRENASTDLISTTTRFPQPGPSDSQVEFYYAIDNRKTNLSRRVESRGNNSYCRQAVYVLSNRRAELGMNPSSQL